METTNELIEATEETPVASIVYTIYCHIHAESGRRYIGQTKKTWKTRWNQHVYKSKNHKLGKRSHFWSAVHKYGPDAFDHEILETCSTLEEANAAEQKWIIHFRSNETEFGFNLIRGGSHIPHSITNPWDRPGYRERNMAASKAALNTRESRMRRSAASKKMWADPEFREKNIAAVKESHARPEVRARLSAAQTGKVLSAEHRAKISANDASRRPEVRKKLSESTKRVMSDPAFREKFAANFRGKKHSEETRAKIIAAGTGRILSEETRKKIASSIKNRPRPTHCRKGHQFDGFRKDGRTLCRKCRNERQNQKRRYRVIEI
jgi:hypothetical protein